MFMDIIGTDLFDQMQVWHVLKLDSGIHGYYCY